ncbi:ATP-dependent DNA helicase, partial [Hortaea werneckii]
MLQGTPEIFEARDGGAIVDKMQRDRLLQNCMAPEIITLKKGAQVMLIKNIDETLVNGSIGRVIGFMDETAFDRYHNNEEETFGQSQGGTIPNASDPGLNEGQKAMVHSINGGGITTSRKFPVVRFVIADGSSRDLLCQPESWKIELPNGEVQASRSQIPLILAWALSIHKAQGQTLDRVKVDLGKVFEKGQAYVA